MNNSSGKVGLCGRIPQILIQLGMALLGIRFQIIRLCCRKIREAFLHQSGQLSLLLKPGIIEFSAGCRHPGGQPQRKGRCQHNKQSKKRIFQHHGAGDQNQLQKSLHKNIKNLMQIAAHIAHIITHSLEEVTNRCLIHIFDGQALDFIRYFRPQSAGKMPAHGLVHQKRVQIRKQTVHCVKSQQSPQPGPQFRKDRAGTIRQSEVIEFLYQLSQKLGSGNRCGDGYNIQQNSKAQPRKQRLCFQRNPAYGLIHQSGLFLCHYIHLLSGMRIYLDKPDSGSSVPHGFPHPPVLPHPVPESGHNAWQK